MNRRSIYRVACIGCMSVGLVQTHYAVAQNANDLNRNLEICLAGRYPSLCNKNWLDDRQRRAVGEAERKANLDVCLTGKYKALCDKSKLSGAELQRVRAAEVRENLAVCRTGRYPTLCDKSLLTPAQMKEVAAAERSAEVPAPAATPRRVRSAPRIRTGGDCESGHWIESVSDDGSIVKLEDGSVWEVDAGDNIDSALWLPTTDIVACSDKLINTEDNEKVGATRIK